MNEIMEMFEELSNRLDQIEGRVDIHRYELIRIKMKNLESSLSNVIGRVLELEGRIDELEEGGKREPDYVENSSAVVLLRLGEGDHSSRAVYEFGRVKEVRVSSEKIGKVVGDPEAFKDYAAKLRERSRRRSARAGHE